MKKAVSQIFYTNWPFGLYSLILILLVVALLCYPNQTQGQCTASSASVTTPIPCFGGTATVTIIATGGTAPYSYTFNSQTNATGVFTGVLAGASKAYSFTDATSCGPVTGTLDVTQPAAALTFTSPVVTDVTCAGRNDGKIVISTSGGTGTISYSINPNIGSQSPTGTFNSLSAQSYSITATDQNSCFITTSVSVGTTADVIPPVISGCPGPITVYTGPGGTTCNQTVTWTEPTAIDNCGGAMTYTTRSHAPASLFPIGITTVIYTFKDPSNNTSTCSFPVTVIDNTPPTFTAPNSITIYSDNSCNYNAPPANTGQANNEADNCPLGAIKATYSDSPRTYGACAGTSTVVRTWSLTDANGNTTTHPQTITIDDNIRPVLTLPPTITIECSASILPANTGQATATDNCGGTISITYSDGTVSGSCAGRSTITRIWTATDCIGNSSSGNQIINIQDTQPPVITCPSNYSVQTPSDIPVVDLLLVTATDNCTASPTIEFVSEVFTGLLNKPGFCPTSVTRTFRAIDACGNISTCLQTITVIDATSCSKCQTSVPFYPVDLSVSATASLRINNVIRGKNGYCCTVGQDNCVSFNILLNPDAVGVTITVIQGAAPSPQDWEIDCSPVTISNTNICVPGDGQFHLFTYCKPGKNTNDYIFTSVTGAHAPGNGEITTRVDCAGNLSVSGITNPTWQSTFPLPVGAYDSYLNDTHSLTPIFIAPANSPPVIKYQVCGTLSQTTCGITTDCDIVTVNVQPKLVPVLNVNPGNICSLSSTVLQVSMSPSGTYSFTWYNGPDGAGTYNVTSPTFTPTSEGPHSVVITETQSGIVCSTVTFNFNVQLDHSGPTFLAIPPPLTVQCNDPNNPTLITNWLASASASYTASDGTVVTIVPTPITYPVITAPCQTLTVTFSASDQCGNISTTTSTITVIDNQVPAITCPPDVSGYADNAECFATGIALGTATATDNCSTPVVTNNAPAQFPVGTNIVTWTATDACGNAATCTQRVTIIDNNQPPVITCPGPVVQTALPNNCALNNVSIPNPAYTDNCGVTLLTWTMSGKTTGSSPATGINYVGGQTFNVGITTVTYTVADAAGNTATCSFTVWIKDLQKPVFSSGCPISITQLADAGMCTAAVNVPVPPITDPCNEGYTVVNSFNNTDNASGSYPVGVTTVHWTITDESGNTNTCDQTITITDNVPPAITCPGNVEQLLISSGCALSNVVIDDPAFSDNCTVDKLTWVMTGATIGNSPASGINLAGGQTYNVGITLVTYTVTDASGNTATCAFNVWIKDLVKPIFNVGCPTDVVQNADAGKCDAAVSVPVPLVSDPCNELVSIVNSFNGTSNASGTYPIGTTTVTWTITDLSGNPNTCVQTVTINDLLPTLTCPPSITVNADFNKPYASNVLIGTPVYADNCPGLTLIWMSSNPTPGASPLTGINIDIVSTFYAGVTTITYTLTDANNHSVTCAFTVTILAKPVILCRNDTTRFTDPGLCTATLNPGFPTKVSGVEPIAWAWVMTGATSASGTGTPILPSPYPFNVGATTITWTATNISGIDTCTQLVTVIDNEPPRFNAAPKTFCVNNIIAAIYDGAGDINPERPDYYIFQAGDLDITGINDNCCALQDMVIHWRIDFTPTPDPLPPHNLVNTPSVSGTGQPSGNIELPGDGVTFLDVTHKITYWIVDCHNNTSAETTVNIIIKPRPNIIKN